MPPLAQYLVDQDQDQDQAQKPCHDCEPSLPVLSLVILERCPLSLSIPSRPFRNLLPRVSSFGGLAGATFGTTMVKNTTDLLVLGTHDPQE